MTFINGEKAPVTQPFPGFQMRALVTKDQGAVSLTVNDVDLEQDGGVAMHIHPNHEEAILVVEGTPVFVLGDETRTLKPGDVCLAPAGVKHDMFNRSEQKAKVVTIFPTTDPQRTFVE